MKTMTNGEAGKIYKSIFRKEIPEIVRERFELSSPRIVGNATAQEQERYRKIVNSVSDLAAVEYASRILGTNPLLIRKFKVMIYLGECLPENYHLFVNEKKRRLRTLLIFTILPFNSVYKFIKGYLTLKLKAR